MEQNLVDFSASNESATQPQNGAVESNDHSIDPSYIISPLTINDDFIYEASISKSLDFDKLIDKPEGEQTQQISETEFVRNEQKEEEQPVEACKLVESTQASDLVEPKEAEQVTNNSYLHSNVIPPASASTSLLAHVANGQTNFCNGASSQSARYAKIQELEKLVQQQNDEIVCLKSALNHTLRRLNMIESNQGSSSRAVSSSSTVTSSFKKSTNNSTSNLANGNSSKPPLSSTAKPAGKNVPRPAGTNVAAKPQAV